MYRAYKINADALHELETYLPPVSSTALATSADSNEYLALKKMAEFVSTKDDAIPAQAIWAKWFPAVNADVFISHSSKDAVLAKRFAALLRNQFGLTSFIDSSVWGHSDRLLKELDNEYCWNAGKETYSYEKRNGSTAHVHALLAHALTKMIDQTECFMFLSTDNSITGKGSSNGTYSPWIFHELAVVDVVEEKPSDRVKLATHSVTKQLLVESRLLKVKYPVIGRKLVGLTMADIAAWASSYKSNPTHGSLDVLYEMTKNAPRAR